MVKHRTRVGLHARNDQRFPEHDYELVRRARIETLKMMSFTDVDVYMRLRRENPNIQFIVRLYDDRFTTDGHPSALQFVNRMVPLINRLRPYATRFEIHNEPNHHHRIEGWGSRPSDARAFRTWYGQVLAALKKACSWAKFGFPGLALNHPHRDLEWLDICHDVIEASHWLGCHCYWQYGNMLSDDWGLRFKLYHRRFPNKRIEITEFGDSTPPHDMPREKIATQYVRYYKELNRYPYLGSACAFIGSSPDPAWNPFVWMKEGGEMLPVVHAVGNMERKPVEIRPKPTPVPGERLFPKTGKTVRGNFLKFFDKYGLAFCGYPITEQFEERGVQSQYFQQVGLEEDKSGNIHLKPVGTEVWTARTKIAQLERRIEELSERPPATSIAKPLIEDMVSDLPTHADKRYPSRALADIELLVIHHTATSPSITPRRLAEHQVKSLDKAGIIYHFVVAANGTIYATNRLQTVSDHAHGHNKGSVGICFPGNFTKTIPPTAQLEAGAQLCAWLLGYLHLSTNRIVGVGEFAETASPGKQWLQEGRWKDKLLAKVEAIIETSVKDQAVLITSLREQIRALEAELRQLKEKPRSILDPLSPEIPETANRLAGHIATLQQQIVVLQKENDRLLAELEPRREAERKDPAALMAPIGEESKVLTGDERTLLAKLAELEGTLQKRDDSGSALVASLRLQIKNLRQEIARLRRIMLEPSSQPGRVTKPPIQDLVDKLPKHDTEQYETRTLSDITALVIHHSATPATITPQCIAQYHVKKLDWPGIGYHFVVSADGVIHQCNQMTTLSYHATRANPFGVGICFLGNFTHKIPPPAQLQAGAHLVAWLLQELYLELDDVKGHLSFTQTACPGRQWLSDMKWKEMLRKEIIKVQQDAAERALEPARAE